MHNRKALYYITGPIGVGKSSLANVLVDAYNLDNLEFISTDLYYYLYFMNDKFAESENYNNAKTYCSYKLEKAVAHEQSFIWESVFAKKEKIAFLQSCVEKGYSLTGLFVGVSDCDILLERVSKRQSENWYDVPRRKIVNRYNEVMANLQLLCDLSDDFIVIDTTGNYRQLAYYKRKNEINYLSMSCDWLGKYLNIGVPHGNHQQESNLQ